MEPDFSGYATKAGLKCSDGRTIMPDAFKHQDSMKVPLVWQHGHNDPQNVLGHVILENRNDGVYAYGYFNKSKQAEHAQELIQHGDINMMSIWANDLIERAKRVLHGAIREVSLVLSGANPGALIENVTIRHSDDEDMVLEDEAIIYTGLTLEHSSAKEDMKTDTKTTDDEEATVQDVYDSMNDEQKEVLHFMIGEALASAEKPEEEDVTHASDDETVQDVFDSMSEKQKQVVYFMVGEALASAGEGGDLKQDNLEEKETDDGNTDDNDNTNLNDDNMKGESMKHNVFETEEGKKEAATLSHSDMEGIIADATKRGSLKEAVEDYALAHGITDIDVLFPDAVNLDTTPQFLARRTEWVGKFLGAARKSPFSRIKTISADLTLEEARAKGYVKGSLKKEEFFNVSRRTTTPTTVYKKQAIDRDDVVDITDFDVVAWLKAEMRLMLDEEIARAALMGDGRDVSDDDKINEQNIRPIAKEHELFATTITVNILDASSSILEVVDAIVSNRRMYKGTGTPTMYTTETLISRFLLLRDSLGRRIYKNLEEVAAELRVDSIVAVEVMEDEPDLLAVIVNPVDYVFGATAGGEVNMFDNFDIDYNKQKYLIETRLSGALTKLKSAIIVRGTASTNVLVTPNTPTFDAEAGELTIVNQTGVVYKNADTDAVINAAGSPYSVASGETINVVATPASGYYFGSSEGDSWSFTAE